jgi:SnoaL-like domain
MEDEEMNDDELERLRGDVEYLIDRQQVLDCVASLSRGHDRHDLELMAGAFHEDGWDEHGTAVNPGPEYGDWANATHAAGSQVNMHHITTHLCEIDGDVAHAESYVLGVMLNPDGTTARLLSGRYLDRLEKRDGTWRIAVRRSTAEVAFIADASILQADVFRNWHFAKGSRDQHDLAYQRPLEIDTPAPEVW